jgi:hypothetical protein|tara:strand:+ start:881 stop:1120 length:240 start_codon:yes stop_codon:yes gene_type:complete
MRKIHGKMDVANRDRYKDIADQDRDHRKKYPSLLTNKPMVVEDTSYQQEVSKNYTIAVAYNKGGYQVIPTDQVKYIGKK